MSQTKKTSNAVPANPTAEAKQPEPAFAPAAEAKQLPTVSPSSFKQSEVLINEYTDKCAKHVTLQDVQRPEYWCHVAARVTKLSKITVINELAGWECYLRVISVGNQWLKVVLLGHVPWQVAERGEEDISELKKSYRIESRADGWRVIDPNGIQVMAGLSSEAEADKLLDATIRNMNSAKAA
jgi:hypothetical protein